MSISNKKKDKDKDKDSKGPAGGEASTNYMIGTSDRGGRTSDKEEEVTTVETTATTTTTAAHNGTTGNEERINTQKEKITSPSQTTRDETPETIVTTPTAASKTIMEVPNTHQLAEQQQHSFSRALDETKENIRKSIEEARSQIPLYTQSTNEYQEQTIQASREIADNFLESQKEIINSLLSAWLPQIDAANSLFTFNWVSPRYFTRIYVNMIGNFADNIVTVTRILNNMTFTNMEAFKTIMQQAQGNAEEFSRIAVNTVKSLQQPARDNAAASTARST